MKALKLVALLFKPLLNASEKALQKSQIKSCIENESFRPTFIVGAPRTGSTLLYQLMTSEFDVAYLSNLNEIACNHILTSIYLERLLPKNITPSFNSTHGRTRGIHSPSECGTLWYRWFYRHPQHANENMVSGHISKDINAVFRNIFILKGQKPLIIKNLACSVRIRALKHIFPNACFIICQRNIIDTACSILQAKQDAGIDLQSWWSVEPQNVNELKTMPPARQVVGQILYINKNLHDNLKQLYANNYISVQYKDVCNKTKETINRCSEHLHNMDIKVVPRQTNTSYDFIEPRNSENSPFRDIVIDAIKWWKKNEPNLFNSESD